MMKKQRLEHTCLTEYLTFTERQYHKTVFIFEPTIILKSFFSVKGETSSENGRNIFESLLVLLHRKPKQKRNSMKNIASIVRKLIYKQRYN